MSYHTSAELRTVQTSKEAADTCVWIPHESWSCLWCKISRDDGVWTVPPSIPLATEEQRAMVKYINKTLGRRFEAVLAEQCSRIIATYYQTALAKGKEKKYE